MRFKNFVGEGNIILPNASKLILSTREYDRYKVEGLQKENLVNTKDSDFKVSVGNFLIKINDKEYDIFVEEKQSQYFAVEITVNNGVRFTVEKIREINKYDIIRELVKNLKNLKEEVRNG